VVAVGIFNSAGDYLIVICLLCFGVLSYLVFTIVFLFIAKNHVREYTVESHQL